jgi:hypothetical protein
MNDINNWPAFLTVVDPSTQEVASPFANPYVVDPTEIDPTGATVHLNPRDWATLECAQQVADTLGGIVTVGPPPWAGSPLVGVTYGQEKYYVTLTGAPFLVDSTTDPAMLANMFPGNLAVLKEALPMFLGIVAGG